MTFKDFFKEESDFDRSVIEIFNFELQMAAAVSKMERKATDRSVRDQLIRLKKRAHDQLRRIEDLCDLYDIVPDGRTSLAVENLVVEAESMELNGDAITIGDKEMKEKAADLERKEKYRLANTLSLARSLNYTEAVQILKEAVKVTDLAETGGNAANRDFPG